MWNVHGEHGPGGCKGGVKRRPRAEWVIQHNMHEPLISDAIAEALRAQLASGRKDNSRDRSEGYQLTGLLRTPDGLPWEGNRTARAKLYRCRGRGSIATERVDSAVLGTIARDLESPE